MRAKTNYNFTMLPTKLFILLDINCRSMLFTLIQTSSFYSDSEGWFNRSYEDLEAESDLSQNLVKATIQTLFNKGIIDVQRVESSKYKNVNRYKVNFESFNEYDEIPLEKCIKNPELKIHTVPYKGSNFKLDLNDTPSGCKVVSFQCHKPSHLPPSQRVREIEQLELQMSILDNRERKKEQLELQKQILDNRERVKEQLALQKSIFES